MTEFPRTLSGDRLELRRWSLEFLVPLLEAIESSYDELHLWMSWAADRPTVATLHDVIEKAERKFDDDARWEYALFERESNECVGSAGLRRGKVVEELEIGYWVRSDRTGRGYATEAARTLTSAAFAAPFDRRRVRISMDAANGASASVPRNLGYLLEEDGNAATSPEQTQRVMSWTVTRRAWRALNDA